MPIINVTNYIEEQGVRKVRFGGLDQEDVRRAVQTLSAEYEQRLSEALEEARNLRQEKDAMQEHCEALTAQNQTLSAQNAALAGSSERYSRRQDELDSQITNLRGRNHTLNDQIALLRMQNDDLKRENAALQDQVEQAEATLRHKGEALDRARAELDSQRQKMLADAQAEADRLREEARAGAEQLGESARAQAEAIEQTAREQARAQARRVVEAATQEANEIQNAHQLRLNDLRSQVRALEKRRDQLSAYLRQIGSELLETESRMQKTAPAEEEPEAEPLELRAMEVPELELDLSPGTLARTAETLRQERGIPADPTPPEAEPTPVVEHAPDPAAEPRRGFTLVEENEPPEASAAAEPPAAEPDEVEIPGAIFSYPIRRPPEEPLPDDLPPAPGPHKPVMPVLPAEEDELPAGGGVQDALDTLNGVSQPTVPVPPPLPAIASRDARRRKAVRALRALKKMRGE